MMENSFLTGRLCHLILTEIMLKLCFVLIDESGVVAMKKYIIRIFVLVLVFLITLTKKVR